MRVHNAEPVSSPSTSRLSVRLFLLSFQLLLDAKSTRRFVDSLDIIAVRRVAGLSGPIWLTAAAGMSFAPRYVAHDCNLGKENKAVSDSIHEDVERVIGQGAFFQLKETRRHTGPMPDRACQTIPSLKTAV
ncbi:hypothetical protein F4860DRAFT_494433 [Xylaria cubensis]|nr:hypothetical protein F4860DRAFT_494433 [Xylaria cubensis]